MASVFWDFQAERLSRRWGQEVRRSLVQEAHTVPRWRMRKYGRPVAAEVLAMSCMRSESAAIGDESTKSERCSTTIWMRAFS